MDDLLIALFQWIKRKGKFHFYNYRGKKNSSFVDYAIALIYENEYEAKYQRLKGGQGEVMIDAEEYVYRVYSEGPNSFYVELLNSLCIEARYKEFANILVNKTNSDFRYHERIDENGNYIIDISCKIESNPKEKDARLYINGYVQETLTKEQKNIVKELYAYKKEHPLSNNLYDYETLTSIYPN